MSPLKWELDFTQSEPENPQAKEMIDAWKGMMTLINERAESENTAVIFWVGQADYGRGLLGGDVLSWLPILLEEIWNESSPKAREKVLEIILERLSEWNKKEGEEG